jgi:hypothetical protein
MRWLSVVAGLVIGAGLFAGGTQFGAHVWPGSNTVAETKVEYQLPPQEQRCDEAWREYAAAQIDRQAHDIYSERVVPLCGLPVPTPTALEKLPPLQLPW